MSTKDVKFHKKKRKFCLRKHRITYILQKIWHLNVFRFARAPVEDPSRGSCLGSQLSVGERRTNCRRIIDMSNILHDQGCFTICAYAKHYVYYTYDVTRYAPLPLNHNSKDPRFVFLMYSTAEMQVWLLNGLPMTNTMDIMHMA